MNKNIYDKIKDNVANHLGIDNLEHIPITSPLYLEFRMFSDGYKQGYFDCLYKSEYIILKHEGKIYKCFELEPFFDTEKQNE